MRTPSQHCSQPVVQIESRFTTQNWKSPRSHLVCKSDASAAPHAGFPVRLTSYRNLTELEEETTDLGWVGAANPTISCLWYNKPRLWYSRERRRRLLPRSLPPPTRICVISRALSSQSRWLTVKGLKKKPKKLNKNKI